MEVATIDAHAGGEPLRVVTGGLPLVPGETMLAKRRWFKANLDSVRTALMWEPRGHPDMYGAVLTEPVTPDGDLGVLFLHNEGYSTMCGHGVIALVTVLFETGVLDPAAGLEVRLDTPAGRVTARADLAGGRVVRVTFENVASFAAALDLRVTVPGWGEFPCDLGFGGAFYAYGPAGAVGLGLEPRETPRLVAAGRAVKAAVAPVVALEHPGDLDLAFLYGVIFDGPAGSAGADLRNVCVFADGEVDRSPTGTGVSGRLAILHARGRLAVGGTLTVESIVGSRFTGRIVRETRVGRFPAIIPEIGGDAWITGRHAFLIPPGDPLGEGFLVR